MTYVNPRRWCVSFIAMLAVALMTAASAGAVGVTPVSVSQSANPGDSIGPITKTVTTPAIPPNPDIVFLIDSTGSMGPAISNVKTGLANIMSTVTAAQPTAQFAVTQFRDQAESPPFHVDQGLTGNQSSITTAINGLAASGGGDAPEDWINGLFQIGTGAISFRPDSTRFVVLVSDSDSHDPSAGHTMADATAALNAQNIHVLAIGVGPDAGSDGIDFTGQATTVAAATGGQFALGAPDQASNMILSALHNQPVTVTHTLNSCDSNLSVSLTPASQTVTSGTNAVFTENIGVGAGAPQGTTIHCTVDFLINGASQGITESIAIAIRDVTAPVVTVNDQTVEATSPAGAVVNLGATAVDNVDGPLTPTCVPPSGSTFSINPTTPGVHSVICSATDSSGNTGTDTATITIVDTTPPVLSLPANMTVEATGPGGAIVNFTATATDIVDVTDPVTCIPASGSLFPVGIGSTSTTVTCSSTDKHGNTSSNTFRVTVRDTTPPATSCTQGPNPGGKIPSAGNNPKSGQNPDGFYTLNAVDIVDPSPTITVTDMGSGHVFGPFPSGTNIKYVQAASGPSISPGTGAVNWKITGTGDALVTGTDASGNSASATCLVPRPPK